MARILCVWSPNWAIANWIRRNPSASPDEAFASWRSSPWSDRAGRAAAGGGGRGRGRPGPFVGQKATDAAALVPDLVTRRGRSRRRRRRAHRPGRLVRPVLPRRGPGSAGRPVPRHHRRRPPVGRRGGDGRRPDPRLARNGLPVRAAIAGSPGAAWALAHFGAAGAIASPGDEAAALAALPAAALRLAPEDAGQIVRLGLSTVGLRLHLCFNS